MPHATPFLAMYLHVPRSARNRRSALENEDPPCTSMYHDGTARRIPTQLQNRCWAVVPSRVGSIPMPLRQAHLHGVCLETIRGCRRDGRH